MGYVFNAPQPYTIAATQQQQSPQPQPQSVQPLFPQPQGNVYNINSTLEVANVPVGAGMSVALCLNEGFMYIKTMQNGNPLFWAYKITPYDNAKSVESNAAIDSDFSQKFTDYDNRFNELEKQVFAIQETLKPKSKTKEEWPL